MKSALSLLLAPAVVSASVLHASCDVTYEFDADCAQVSATLAGFIQGKDGWRDPKGGDYVLQGTPLPDLVQGTRTTASGEYTDDFEFNLSASDKGCTAKASSQSEALSFYDFSTNFCNTFNLANPIASSYKAGSWGSCLFHDVSQCTPSE